MIKLVFLVILVDLLLVCSFAHGYTYNEIQSMFRNLKNFCDGKHSDFCSNEQMSVSLAILNEKLDHFKVAYQKEKRKR